MATLIVIAILALLFAGAVWAKSGQAGDRRPALGHNAPWPESVFPSPPGVRSPLGSPETLESEPGPEWADVEDGAPPPDRGPTD